MLLHYCERTAPGLWGEPLNVISNIAFLIAAWASWRFAVRLNKSSAGINVLIGLIAAVGIGSAIFHTIAARWSELFDGTPIFLFQVSFIWLHSRLVFKFRYGTIISLLSGFVAFMGICGLFHNILNNSLVYAPTLVMLVIFGIIHARLQKKEKHIFFLAGLTFFLSLSFRTIDLIICPCFPAGTHFLWHVFNGLMLYLVMRALIINAAGSHRLFSE